MKKESLKALMELMESIWHFPPFSLQSSLELMERCKFICGSVDGVQCDILLLKDVHTMKYFLLDIQQKKKLILLGLSSMDIDKKVICMPTGKCTSSCWV